MTREWSAIILAGGKGSRLMPLTAEIPKPLVKVTNKPMVDYSIAHLIYADIKHIIMTPGVKIGAKAGELRQKYAGPEEAIYAGSDIIIVGSGIHGADDPLRQAKLYREIAWEAYEKRGKMAKR